MKNNFLLFIAIILLSGCGSIGTIVVNGMVAPVKLVSASYSLINRGVTYTPAPNHYLPLYNHCREVSEAKLWYEVIVADCAHLPLMAPRAIDTMFQDALSRWGIIDDFGGNSEKSTLNGMPCLTIPVELSHYYCIQKKLDQQRQKTHVARQKKKDAENEVDAAQKKIKERENQLQTVSGQLNRQIQYNIELLKQMDQIFIELQYNQQVTQNLKNKVRNLTNQLRQAEKNYKEQEDWYKAQIIFLYEKLKASRAFNGDAGKVTDAMGYDPLQ